MAGSVEEAHAWIKRAEETLGAASSLLEDGYYRDAVSRAYYAMFYAAKAAVSLDGVNVSKHSAVVSAFGLRFTKKGRLPQQLHRALLEAFEDRQAADYKVAWLSTQDQAARRVSQAEEFVSRVREILA